MKAISRLIGSCENLAGKKFGKWTVIKFDHKTNISYWLCRCECGTESIVASGSLKGGGTLSCGCTRYTIKALGLPLWQEGLHSRWSQMIRRCTDPQNTAYVNYGGRGISVCERWTDFLLYLEDVGEPPDHKQRWTIERINNNGNYEPTNCMWALPKQQARNRRSSRLIEYNGETKTLAEWCEVLGLDYRLVHLRIRRGRTVEDAFTSPINLKQQLNSKRRWE